ncbi:MAG: HAMP domain-containing histidine kinase [Lachnospiraceae bacterium]|nr:HAMP domain-containing histidine kinase [Lachnospiraceae bacterium]
MKHNIFQSLRMKLALYVFLSCGLTILTDVGILALIRVIQWNIRKLSCNSGVAAIYEMSSQIFKQYSTVTWIVMAILSVLLFLIYYIILTSPTISYVREILSGVERIKNGDLDTKIAVRSNGELSELALAINTMQAELKNSIAKEREAEHVKDELITNVAHDLRTPLTSVIGYLNLLRDSEKLSEQTKKKYIQIAYDKAARMEGLVTDLFDFTRYEKNKIAITRQRLELKQFMEQIIDEFYPSLKSNQLECYTIFTPEKVYMDGDGELLARAFGNLMGNAIKYGSEGKQIRVEINNFPDLGRIRVAITNYGRIIPKKDLDKIFDKFYRGDTSRSTGGGTGLGLAIAKNIFEMHNGTIQVRSDEQGTVFEVLFQVSERKELRS